MFTKKDLQQISEKGISTETINKQLKHFKTGFPFAEIVAPATIDKGIHKLSDEKIDKFVNLFEEKKDSEKIVKFVPASGVASRMFKALFSFITEYDGNKSFFEDKSFNSIYVFFNRLKDFAFYDDLKNACINEHIDINDKYVEVIDSLLNEHGLNYGNLPKGLLKFHRYKNGARTPVEEHIVEAANYANSNNKAALHLTVSPEHKKEFQKHVSEVKKFYGKKFNLTIEVDYSVQKSSTDTIAVDMKNEPFRNEDGTLLFRPGGHGALIENLNDIDADIIFVKNIDNVVPDRMKPDTYTYKKVIAGVLIDVRDKIFSYIKQVQNNPTEDLLSEIKSFFINDLFLTLSSDYEKMNPDEKKNYILQKLNRPLRVCGMVKNEGEPGGGPFFIKHKDNSVSLQIIESAQIDLSSSKYKEIVEKATHFNPVDLVTSVKNYKHERFNLLNFIDDETGFISTKSKDGKELKAQELPGLWNGAMADWNTIFVEVPISTFNPVKTVIDLLRKEHQPN